MRTATLAALFLSLALPRARAAEDPAKAAVLATLDRNAAAARALASDVWNYAEVGYQEAKSAERHMRELRAAGFTIEAPVAGIPTAFVASWGQGKPVLAFLAEYDALPGLSQQAVPEQKPRLAGAPGHACGHHLLGTASTEAAIAVKEYLAASKSPGTVRLYGTPAEEGGGGKVYMIRAGLFKDVDAALAWHPADANDASPKTSLANKSAKFRFHGKAAHASANPEQGRSALDGVEAMDNMVNMLREHVPSAARIHYIITKGGDAPNIVPAFAESFYYARHQQVPVLEDVWSRIVKAAEGAALGTGTTVDIEIINAVYSLLPNTVLSRAADANMRRIGGYRYTAEEQAFAESIRKTLISPALPLGSQADVQEFAEKTSGGSTDLADVSWVVPTLEIEAATWVPGTPAHSWQAVAAGATAIGEHGMQLAARTLALTAVDLLQSRTLLGEARAEFDKRRGPGFSYQPLVGGRNPPLDYRK
jgi:aminobenzoyl-glutamate utilization protein B